MTAKKQLIALNKETGNELELKKMGEKCYEYSAKEYNMNIAKTADGFTMLQAGDKTYPIELLSHHQNEYNLLLNGVEYNLSLESKFSLARKKVLNQKAAESPIIRLKAPMPGKILEVMVKTGDMVKAGDTLLILEAMKMQNAILASTKGIIKKVLVKEGDATSKSDLLIELEREL
ncbi:MAG: biotin/lipoyl-containing protein [Mangrovibacterium sp.]